MQVGTIEGWPVEYIPEKDIVFCKNTAVPLKVIERMLASSLDREVYEKKNLSIVKLEGVIYFGCLTTSTSNVREIKENIKKINKHACDKKQGS
jgi:hypothetical protein